MKTVSGLNWGFEICPASKFSEWGQADCADCPNGFLCPKGQGYGYEWSFSCPKGSWCALGVETKCPKGTFGTMERATTEAEGCEKCPAGYDC